MLSPFTSTKFKLFFAGLVCLVTALHAFVLHGYGFDWKISIWDGIVNNLLLGFITFLITVILQYYIPQKNRYSYFIALCGMLTLIWILIIRMALLNLISTHEYKIFFNQSLPVRGAIGFLVICCMSLISVLLYNLQDQQEAEKRKGEAERLSKEAELFKLRQQLQPHFLFNSLNSINALIGSNPDKARGMILQLSDFLRGTLKKSEQQWSTLHEELEQVQLYLEIEKVRFGHRLSATVSNNSGDEMRIPSMLLQPIVENAIKFGLYDTTGEVSITIDAIQENGELIMLVTNPYDPETTSGRGTGFGLSSVKRRLFLLFARNDLLQTHVLDNLFFTTIKIPQQS